MTRWAKEVSPDKVHPEYPRPQLVRRNWQNLNGEWTPKAVGAAERAYVDRTAYWVRRLEQRRPRTR